MSGSSDTNGTSATLRATTELYCPNCETSFMGLQRCPKDGTELIVIDDGDPYLGKEIDGRFTLRKQIGRGGMGAVYLARQHSVDRDVAIKVIDPRHSLDKTTVKRFLREAKVSSQFSHPNSITVFDFGRTHDKVLYLVMEKVEGQALDRVLAKEGRLSPERVIRIGRQVCDVLDAASPHGIVHRDLKPGNIMLLDRGDDVVKVLDFGLARSVAGDENATLTSTDMVVGTPAYIAPETAMGRGNDSRADLYSVGVILYELVAGRLPYDATTPNAMVIAHVQEEPLPLPDDVPAALAEVIFRLLEKSPTDRFPSAAATRDALTAISAAASLGGADEAVEPADVEALEASPTLEAPVVAARASTPSPVHTRVARPHRWALWVGLVLVLAGAGTFGARWLSSDEPRALGHETPEPVSTADPPAAKVPEPAGVPEIIDSPPAATPAPAPAPVVEVRFESDPAGARVTSEHFEGCTTPCSRTVDRTLGSIEVTFTKRGHAGKVATVDLGAPDPVARISLATNAAHASKGAARAVHSSKPEPAVKPKDNAASRRNEEVPF